MEFVRSQPLYEVVYEYIKKEIISGEIDEHGRFNEAQIARRLNVSRGPVREAVRKLEQDGLLIREKTQLFVYKPNAEDIEHIYQCRKALECLAVELAAQKINAEEIEHLTKLIEKKKDLIESQSVDDEKIHLFVELCHEFHTMIIQASRNPRLEQQISQLKTLTFLYRHYNAKDPKRREVVFNEHHELYQALKARDPIVSSQLMAQHISHDLEHLSSIFKDSPAKTI